MAIALLALALPASAPAAVAPLLQVGGNGDGAGRLGGPSGLAIDAVGRMYVSEAVNARISVFEPDGRFAYAFGWNVDPGGIANGFEVCTTICQKGSQGEQAGAFGLFVGHLAVDAAGRLYVADHTRVSVFDVSRGPDVRFLRAFGAPGAGSGQLLDARGLAVSRAGDELYVADWRNARINVFSPAGTFLRAFGANVSPLGGEGFEVCVTTCQAGAEGGARAQLRTPAGASVDGAGLLYVTEEFNSRVSVYDPRGPSPSFLRARGWDVDPDDASAGFETCTTACRSGVDGVAGGQLIRPTDVEVDRAGTMTVMEFFGRRVSRFGTAGFVDVFGGDVIGGNADVGFEVCAVSAACKQGSFGAGSGELPSPTATALDCRGAVWIADAQNNRVQRFAEAGTPPPPCPAPVTGAGGGGRGAPPRDLDRDADGVTVPRDCDDGDPGIRPGARDKPGDEVDQDCDGRDAPFPLLDRSIEAFSATFPRGRFTRFTSIVVRRVRRGDRLRLTCTGPGCELRSKSLTVRKRASRLSLLRHLKGSKLRKGAVVQLRVTRPETIGRVATWRIRAPKIPRITRSCLPPGARKPGRCPR